MYNQNKTPQAFIVHQGHVHHIVDYVYGVFNHTGISGNGYGINQFDMNQESYKLNINGEVTDKSNDISNAVMYLYI